MRTPTSKLILFGLIFCMSAASLVQAADNGAQKPATSPGRPAGSSSNSTSNAVMLQIQALDQQEKVTLQNLGQQMADLGQKHQSEITPLQQQLSTLNAAFQS